MASEVSCSLRYLMQMLLQIIAAPVGTVGVQGLTYYNTHLTGTYTFGLADTFRFEVTLCIPL